MSEENKNLGEEINEENKVVTDNDEILEFQKEVMGKLDNPLVVHKKSDSSYEEDTSAFEMNQTHNDEERPTLERHRFRKEPKKRGSNLAVVLFLLIVAAGVFAGLYYTGHTPFNRQEKTSETVTVTEEETTNLTDKYVGKIVVKDTYIFVDGVEVEGIQGLQEALKYVTPSPTAYEIVIEHANSEFLNDNVYNILTDLGFFSDKTVVTHIDKTGLMSAEEIAAEEAATAKETVPETETAEETEPVSE